MHQHWQHVGQRLARARFCDTDQVVALQSCMPHLLLDRRRAFLNSVAGLLAPCDAPRAAQERRKSAQECPRGRPDPVVHQILRNPNGKLISHLSESDRCEMQLTTGRLHVCGCGVS